MGKSTLKESAVGTAEGQFVVGSSLKPLVEKFAGRKVWSAIKLLAVTFAATRVGLYWSVLFIVHVANDCDFADTENINIRKDNHVTLTTSRQAKEVFFFI
jgi:hypothetical protein